MATVAGVSVLAHAITAAANHEDAGAEHEKPDEEANPAAASQTFVD